MCPAKKTENGSGALVDFSQVGTDEAVSALLASAGRKQADSRKTKPERNRKARERRRQAERMSGRIGLDLPVPMKRRLVALAAREGVPVSQLVAFMLIDPLADMEAATNPLWGYTRPSRCAVFVNTIDLEKRMNERS